MPTHQEIFQEIRSALAQASRGLSEVAKLESPSQERYSTIERLRTLVRDTSSKRDALEVSFADSEDLEALKILKKQQSIAIEQGATTTIQELHLKAHDVQMKVDASVARSLNAEAGQESLTLRQQSWELVNEVTQLKKLEEAKIAGVLQTAQEPAKRPDDETNNRNNWWSVLHGREFSPNSSKYYWHENSIGAQTQTVTNDGFDSLIRVNRQLTGLKFRDCDFRGVFAAPDANQIVTFKNFEFEGCCFGASLWKRVKFQKCTFKSCDLSFARFEGCIFTRECLFQDISFSASHTSFSETSILASRLLANPALNTTAIPKNQANLAYQKARLAATMVKIAHAVLHSTRFDPSSEVFFDAYKVYVRSSKRAQISENIYRIRTGIDLTEHPVKGKATLIIRGIGFFMLIIRAFDYAVTEVSGFLNNWGESILRPIAFAAAIAVVFSLIYWHVDKPDASWWPSLRMGIDVTLVAGYTKYTFQDETRQWLLLANLILGVSWYSIFVPTIVRHTMRG